MKGILSYGTYVPGNRLAHDAMHKAVLGAGHVRGGTRAVAHYDEDTTTMAVEAASAALAAAGQTDLPEPEVLWLATTDPAYLVKNNASAVHAALGLPNTTRALDGGASTRAGLASLIESCLAPRTALVVAADTRQALPGSADEREVGDAAAAFVVGADDGLTTPVIAELLGQAAATTEIMDRWRQPESPTPRRWEEAFAAEVYPQLGQQALDDALKASGVTVGELDRLVVTSTNQRAAKALVKSCGARREALVDDLVSQIGHSGCAHAGLLLAAALDQAAPGELVGIVSLADGADAAIFRVTDAILERRQAPSVLAQVASGHDGLAYQSFLKWRGLMQTEPVPRPAPAGPQGPPALRASAWKFGLTGSRCEDCGTVQLPAQRVCSGCHSVDAMVPHRVSGTTGTVVAATTDRLAWSPEPPATFAVVDFDGGGRAELELTELGATPLEPGLRVLPSFRRAFTADGIHNYVWKVRPQTSTPAQEH